MGIFDWGTKKSAPAPSSSSPFPAPGSRLDSIPAMDDDSLLCIRQWLDDWFNALAQQNNPTLMRLLTTYGEALDGNGVRATFAAMQKGIDGDAPRQRPWRWLSLGAARANEYGDFDTTIKIFYFMLQFDSFVREAIEADDVDGFIEIGIDPPTLHSKFLVAEQAEKAMLQAENDTVATPLGDLSTGKLLNAVVTILEPAEGEFGMDFAKARGQFLVGAPLGGGVWADSKSGEFKYGRRIQS